MFLKVIYSNVIMLKIMLKYLDFSIVCIVKLEPQHDVDKYLVEPRD